MHSATDPLLDAPMAERALAIVALIQQHLDALPVGYSDNPRARLQGSMCLDCGRVGNALFWAYTRPPRGEQVEAALDQAIDELGQVPSLTPSLWAGFCGTAWAVEHVEARLGLVEGNSGVGQDDAGEEEDANDDIDTALATALGAPPGSFAYDLPKGLAGFAVYALERHRRRVGRVRAIATACLERIVEHLLHMRVQTPHGRAWNIPVTALPKDRRGAHPDGAFHRGLAHGVPAVLVTLARIAASGIRTDACGEMLHEAVSWLRATDGGRPEVPSWCSGACGRAAALVLAGELLDEPAWRSAGIEMARASAERPASRLRDAGICHGTAGVAHTFHRLYQLTGDPVLADAARDWVAALLDQIELADRTNSNSLGSPNTGVLEDRFGPHTAPPGHVAQLQERGGLLRGAGGVGLVLLAAIDGEDAAWDRCLLLRA